MLAVGVLLAIALKCLPAAAGPAAFAAVQPELFGIAGSLSNAWGDMDGDGDPDLAVSLKSGEVRLYRNDRGVFASVGAELGLPVAGYELRGLSWGDFDGDADLDLLAGASAPQNRSYVFRNDGAKGFVEVGEAIGLTLGGRAARQTSFVDYDSDGDLDVYAANRLGGNTLLRNDDGRFTPVLAGAAPSDTRPTVGACWFDADRDGDLDLFLANQSGATDALWRNDGERFVDVAPELGMHSPGRAREDGGVGCAIGDYDNDGDFDLFVASYGRNKLYRNEANGRFTEVGQALGVGVENHAVGASWGDYDNDGDLDLFVSAYEGPRDAQIPQAKLFRNDGPAGFVDVIATLRALNAADHGVEWIDYDSDGALDLSVTDGYGPDGGHFVFRNELPKALRQRSLAVLVLDEQGRFTCPGAEVRLLDASGRPLASRLVPTGGGYNAQSAVAVHFGLRNRSRVSIEVTFMSREGRRTQLLRDVDPRAHEGRALVVRRAR